MRVSRGSVFFQSLFSVLKRAQHVRLCPVQYNRKVRQFCINNKNENPSQSSNAWRHLRPSGRQQLIRHNLPALQQTHTDKAKYAPTQSTVRTDTRHSTYRHKAQYAPTQSTARTNTKHSMHRNKEQYAPTKSTARTSRNLPAPCLIKELQGQQQLDQRVFQAADEEGPAPVRTKGRTSQCSDLM